MALMISSEVYVAEFDGTMPASERIWCFWLQHSRQLQNEGIRVPVLGFEQLTVYVSSVLKRSTTTWKKAAASSPVS